MTLPVPNPSNGKEGAVAHRFLNAVPRIKGFGRIPANDEVQVIKAMPPAMELRMVSTV